MKLSNKLRFPREVFDVTDRKGLAFWSDWKKKQGSIPGNSPILCTSQKPLQSDQQVWAVADLLVLWCSLLNTCEFHFRKQSACGWLGWCAIWFPRCRKRQFSLWSLCCAEQCWALSQPSTQTTGISRGRGEQNAGPATQDTLWPGI